jgi:DNA (cytosine-5)-methyltransferase 1
MAVFDSLGLRQVGGPRGSESPQLALAVPTLRGKGLQTEWPEVDCGGIVFRRTASKVDAGSPNVMERIPMGLENPIAVDLFCGAGGLSEGLLAAGIDVVVGVERHPDAALTCAMNHPSTHVICDDVARVTEQRIREILAQKGLGKRPVDLVVGGPPCQGFSAAGARKREDPRNLLFRRFVALVKALKPRMFLFENVPGFLSMHGGFAFTQATTQFSRLGYQLHGIDEDAKVEDQANIILNARWYGVPQNRNRLLIVGWRPGEVEGGDRFEWVRPTRGNEVSVGDALSDLDFLKAGEQAHAYVGTRASKYQKERRKNSGGLLLNHLASRHNPTTLSRFARMSKPGDTMRSIPEEFRTLKHTVIRMDREKCSRAVLALPDDMIHYGLDRILTVREMARLQSFDDDFVFMGKRTTSEHHRRVDVPQYTQVGNAVPPLLARKLGESIRRFLVGNDAAGDLRRLSDRRERSKWLRGSSAGRGYKLTLDAQQELGRQLTDANLVAIDLPMAEGESHPGSSATVTKWKARGAASK